MADIAGGITTTAVFDGNPLTGASYSGEFEAYGDADWVRISLVAGTTYSFYGHAQSSGPFGNSVLHLYDSTGAQIIFDDDGGVGSNSFFSYTATASGTYFVGINEFQGDPGLYSIDVTAVAAPTHELSDNADSHVGYQPEIERLLSAGVILQA